MKKVLAMGLACCLPLGLAAEHPDESTAYLGTVDVLVMDESVPIAKDVLCARAGTSIPGERASEDCMAVHRAVLTARIQKVSALRQRGRWM
jgi:hypothetical protein